MVPHTADPLARSPWVERLNGWLEAAWQRGLSNRPTLDPAHLWAAAARKAPAHGETAGRSEGDVRDFRVRLERLCGSLRDEARLNPLGLTMAHGQLVRTIRQRLRLGALWRRQASYLQTELAAPILVIGHMRGGTTRVHRLLAADPAHAATRFCDSWHPLPERPDVRPLRAAATLAVARTLDPWLDAIHPFGTTRADEELGWLASALDACAYEAQWHIPSYVQWAEARDPAPIYREFARILRTDAAHRGNAQRTRVMKVPQFAQDLTTLLSLFPAARVVVARRDLRDVLRSSATLVANQMTVQSDAVDPVWIGEEWRRKVALRENRMAAGLRSFSGRVAELDYEALERNWRGAIRTCYDSLGLDFTPRVEAAMAAEMARGRKRPVTPRPALESFGVAPVEA